MILDCAKQCTEYL